jgi:hypothetical protein
MSPVLAQGNSKSGEALISVPLKGVQYARTAYSLRCQEAGKLHLEVKMMDANIGATVQVRILTAEGEVLETMSQGAANNKETYVRLIDVSSLPNGNYSLQIGPSPKPTSISFVKGNTGLHIN